MITQRFLVSLKMLKDSDAGWSLTLCVPCQLLDLGQLGSKTRQAVVLTRLVTLNFLAE